LKQSNLRLNEDRISIIPFLPPSFHLPSTFTTLHHLHHNLHHLPPSTFTTFLPPPSSSPQTLPSTLHPSYVFFDGSRTFHDLARPGHLPSPFCARKRGLGNAPGPFGDGPRKQASRWQSAGAIAVISRRALCIQCLWQATLIDFWVSWPASLSKSPYVLLGRCIF
jgi:hypothetical protein